MNDEEDRFTRLEEEAKRRLEIAEGRYLQNQVYSAAVAEVQRQGALEQAKLQIDHAPVNLAITLTQQAGASLYQQNEITSKTLGELLLTVYKGTEERNIAFIRVIETVLKSRLDHLTHQSAQRHEIDKSFLEIRREEEQHKHSVKIQQLSASLAISLERIKTNSTYRNAQQNNDSQYKLAISSAFLSIVQTLLNQNHESLTAKTMHKNQVEKTILEGLMSQAQRLLEYRHAIEVAFANSTAHQSNYLHDKIVNFSIWLEMQKRNPAKASEDQIRAWFSEFEAEIFSQNP